MLMYYNECIMRLKVWRNSNLEFKFSAILDLVSFNQF